jgi:elongation factor 2
MENIEKIARNPEKIRNIAIIAHIDHGKTTMTDSLLSGAKIISEKRAGQQRYMDFDPEQRKRGITINASTISFVYKDYLINLIDTPGHADFGGDVTKAMRAIDGVIVVVDSVEGIMPQTETVLRQAIKENVKPILFINKVDRLICELMLDYKDIRNKIKILVDNLNSLILKFTENPYIEKFSFQKGNIIIGSALNKWGLNKYSLTDKDISFQKVCEIYKNKKDKTLSGIIDLNSAILQVVTKYLPNPIIAQENKIDKILRFQDPIKDIIKRCDINSEMRGIVTDILFDKNLGEVVFARLFSGKIKKSDYIFSKPNTQPQKILRVGILMARQKKELSQVVAGNICILQGLSNVNIGDTISDNPEFTPFELIKHTSEPVITVSIAPKTIKDLSKLTEVIDKLTRQDNTLISSFNQETGEHLLSGLGNLHLQIIVNKISRDSNIPLKVSEPRVIFRESIENNSQIIQDITSNRHNKFKISIFKLSKDFIEFLNSNSQDYIKKNPNLKKILLEFGIPQDLSKKLIDIRNCNLIFNTTRGVQYLDQTMPNILLGFYKAIKSGPILNKQVIGLGVKLEDCDLHIDHMHRGPSQIAPTISKLIHKCMLDSKSIVLQPLNLVNITIPIQYMNSIIRQIQKRRGKIIQNNYEDEYISIKSKIPVLSLKGFSDTLMSLTTGKVNWNTEYLGFEKLPETILEQIKQVSRKE